ncbi:FlgD immunoglobulin-like domain containing protein [Candidatus Eisenbacteria bacterium]|uniref:FlgD immunoglobulin-like domain containing protein n=1 Tax=Eiseniibacteriota bacterium TaxID=2212470 RepID=A0ABV6YJ75_UNCEI
MTHATGLHRGIPLVLLMFSLTAIIGISAGEKTQLGDQKTHALRSSVVGTGGSYGSSPGYVTQGTIGQPGPVGVSSDESLTLYSGYWGPLFLLTSGAYVWSAERPENALFQNHPNPCRSSTVITFAMAVEGDVQIQIFDITGRRVRALLQQRSPPGAYAVIWDGRDDSGTMALSGVYFYQLKLETFTAVKRMLVLR